MAAHRYERLAGDDGDPAGYTAKPRSRHRKPSVLWLLPIFFLFNFAMGATSMPRMNVIASLICRDVMAQDDSVSRRHSQQSGYTGRTRRQSMEMSDTSASHNTSTIIIGEFNPQCSSKEVESATAMLNLWGNLIASIIAALATPIWGRLSDTFGRVRPLAATTSIMLLSETIMVLVARFPDALPLSWVFVTFVLEGISGSFILIMALASSYAADCTKPEDRNLALGWFHGSMFFGMAAGPVFGGLIGMIGGHSRPLLIFYTGLALRALGVLSLALVPESLPMAESSPRPLKSQLKQSPPWTSWGSLRGKLRNANPLLIVTQPNESVDRITQKNLLVLASINTILFGIAMAGMNIMMLYSEFRFGWGNRESGIFLSTVSIFRTLATVVLLPTVITLSRRFVRTKDALTNIGMHHTSSHEATSPLSTLDVLLLRISAFSDLLGYIGYAVSPTGTLFILSGVIASIGAIGLATSEATMSKLVPHSKMGEVLGALGFLQGLARIIAPTVAGLVYSWTTDIAPQLVFWSMAVCSAVAGLATWKLSVESGPEESRGLELASGPSSPVLRASEY